MSKMPKQQRTIDYKNIKMAKTALKWHKYRKMHHKNTKMANNILKYGKEKKTHKEKDAQKIF